LLLQFVARELGDSRLLLLATYCDGEAPAGAPFVELLPNLRRSNRMRTLELHGFDDSGVKRLLESCGAAGLPSSLVQAIARETLGNPFFVQETWRHLCDERIVVRDRGGWRSTTGTPSIGIAPGLREILERRLARLSEGCRKVLSAAAVVGRVFAAGFLAELDGVGSATEVRDRLDEAIRARVVLRVPKLLDRYGFSHELVREALYGGLPSTQRRKLHRRVARALAESACESRLSEISYHSFEAAKAGIGVEEAADYARRAGEHAQARLAWEEAALQFRRALDLGGPDDAHRLATLSALGGAELRGGNRARARPAFEEAIALARSRGDAVAMARAAIECAGPPMLGMGASTRA